MDKTLIVLVSIFFLLTTLFTTLVVFNPQIKAIRALSQTVCLSCSFVLAYPLSAKADGVASAKLSVVVRDSEKKAYPKGHVTVSTDVGSINPQTVLSDDRGIAEFTLISTQPGVAHIKALVNNQPIDHSVTVLFE